MKVALCIIATGKYTCFLDALLSSAREFFCLDHEVQFFVFSDTAFQHPRDLYFYHTSHERWPGPTIHRYRTMLQAPELTAYDYVYYVDADSLFIHPVGDEIFSDSVAVLHYANRIPGWAKTYERRSISRACIAANEALDVPYYFGAFQGGRVSVFTNAMRTLNEAIVDDEQRGVEALWQDESHWNRYLIDHPPTLALPYEYVCFENHATTRILCLEKNHAEMRSAT